MGIDKGVYFIYKIVTLNVIVNSLTRTKVTLDSHSSTMLSSMSASCCLSQIFSASFHSLQMWSVPNARNQDDLFSNYVRLQRSRKLRIAIKTLPWERASMPLHPVPYKPKKMRPLA